MKHLLNDMSEQEKNAIREQHTDKFKIVTKNFSKLSNSKLGDSKPLVSEQTRATGWNEQGESGKTRATGWNEQGESGNMSIMTMEQFLNDPNWGGRQNPTGGNFWKVNSGFSDTEIVFGKDGKKIRVKL